MKNLFFPYNLKQNLKKSGSKISTKNKFFDIQKFFHLKKFVPENGKKYSKKCLVCLQFYTCFYETFWFEYTQENNAFSEKLKF